MASTATLHTHHWRLPAVHTLRFGWPRKLAASAMVLIGAAFVAVTVMANLFRVGPAFDRLSDGFRPIMTHSAIQTARQDVAGLSAAGKEIQTALLPALAQQLNVTPAQLQAMLETQYPYVATGLRALPTITPQFTGLVDTMDRTQPLFVSADAIPTKDIPAASMPWSLLVVGLLTAGLGVFVWFSPRLRPPLIVAVVGAALVALPLSFGLLTKASDADQMNANLKPLYNQALIANAGSALQTMTAMGTQMQQEMLPQLAAQLHMTQPQLQAMLTENFPATARALQTMPATLTRFQDMVSTFDRHLGDYRTLRPVSFEPIVWFMLISGGVLFGLGAVGVAVCRRPDAQP